MKATDAAWLAAIIDGEGYIDVPLCRIKVTNCDLKLLQETQRIAGGGRIYSNGTPQRANHRQAYRWDLQAKADVKRVLNAVGPRLITKRAKSRAVLEAIK